MSHPQKRSASSEFLIFGLEADLRSDLGQALLLLGELRNLTQWYDDDVLCRRLGCSVDRKRARKGARAEALMRHSLAYLSWVRELAQLVDLTEDRREVVSAAYRFCAGAAGPLEDRVDRCRAAFDCLPEGTLPARELLQLGEIAQAWHVAALQLAPCPTRRRAERVERIEGQLAQRRPHIHPDRRALLRGHDPARVLGTNVAAAMEEHLRDCTSCRKLATPESLDEIAA